MRLSDIMSAMHLESYAEVALLIFFVVFLAITIRVLRDRSGRMDEAARIPLDSDPEAEASKVQEDRRRGEGREANRREEDRQELQFGGQP